MDDDGSGVLTPAGAWSNSLSCRLCQPEMGKTEKESIKSGLTYILPMKKALLVIVFILLSGTAYADKLMADEHRRSNPHYEYAPRQAPPPSTVNDVPDRIANMFLDQGVIGAMLLILGFWFYKTESQARVDRNKMNEKFEELIRESFDKTDLIEVKTSIAAINQQMQNLEREIETLKDFVLSGRIGGNRG